jgi:hypothetical protein
MGFFSSASNIEPNERIITMSIWTTVRNDAETDFQDVVTFVEGSTLTQQLETDVKDAMAELKSIGETDLKAAVTSIGVAALSGLASGGTAGAIAAGIAAAPAAFEAAGKDISTKTTSTLVTSVVNSLATVAPTPAPASAA